MASSGTTTMEQSKKFNKAFVSVAGKLQNPSRFKRFGRSSPFIRYGLPMISFTVLGTLGLSHLLQGRLILIHQLSMCMYCIAHYSTILNYCMDILCINFLFFSLSFSILLHYLQNLLTYWIQNVEIALVFAWAVHHSKLSLYPFIDFNHYLAS